MSRCFPFPPPGYEKKATSDDVNLLIKEKHKEKRHKKDKDKKERSERKEKERSVDKQGEKKDREQKKHEDRKDKKKHKDKHRTSEEKKIVGLSEHQNGKKLGSFSELGNAIPNSNIFVELQRRVENDCGATDSQMVGEIMHSDQRSAKLPGKVEESDKREYARMVNGESLEINAMGLENGKISIFARENGKKIEGGALSVEKVEKCKEGKDKNKHKTSDGKRDRHKKRERDTKCKSKDKVGEKEKVKERSKDLTNKQRESNGDLLDVHNKPSDLLKVRHGSQGSLGKQKEPELNGFSCSGIPLKLPRPVSSSHQVVQNVIGINSSQNTVNLAVEKAGGFQNHTVNFKNLPSQSVGNGRKLEHGQTANHLFAEQWSSTSTYVVNNSLVSSHPVLGISQKTEPFETASKVETLQPMLVNNHKADDKVSTSLVSAESGRRMETNQPNTHRAVESRGVVIKHKMDNKDSRVNGIIDPKPYASSSTPYASVKGKESSMKPPHSDSKNLSQIHSNKDSQVNGICVSSSTPSASVKLKENRVKLPHPDSKYLTQILNVPNVEWPEFDDQEWLFGSEGSRAKRPKIASNQIERTEEVWAEAIPVKSADVIALPYVIPY
ncbi:uncharacterized protein LOC111371301 isoform X2 [Olea europaea var. sylvestris]|uniref:uncharacterized protein LOC111371301 isoform X2 n=1 Tax=Olea europaea var. sylvestris TaxID=158386 RepID=UPI000C1CFD35|nr:uncharacterized protein LOC111371301 isoform X2 [Olea europaea var. sylvestris]